MPLNLDELSPYRSLLLCTCPAAWGQAAAVEELRQLVEALDDVQHVEAASTAAQRHHLTVQCFYYRVEHTPTWTTASQLVDQTHELVVLFRRNTDIAILTTERRLRDRLRAGFAISDGTRLGLLTPIPAAKLNAAFVRGKTNTLWLTGTHRQVPSRVDAKALSGSDLLYALDPLGDQTFYFTSAVSKLPNNAFEYKVGVSPHRSYVWGGPSADGDTLCAGVARLFDILQTAPVPTTNPLPMLASPAMDTATVAMVANAYEAALLPSELLDYDLPASERTEADKWSRLHFDIVATRGMDFDASMSLVTADGIDTPLGSIRVAFDVSKPERIKWTATQLNAAPPQSQTLQTHALEVINVRTPWLKVWFETGHTLVDQKLFTGSIRDAQFDFTFGDFSGFDVKVEKPSPLTVPNIGATTSLFCWVRSRWHRALPHPGAVSGWLACNDGAMEIADFIHFEDGCTTPELTLIHVKGSKSAAAARQLSVSDYEVVVGQAVKNLRFLDLQQTLINFTTALNAKLMNASWLGGIADTRARMIAAMSSGGPSPKRRVVIVQPRVSQTALNAARGAPATSRQHMIARQLDTLLLAARANCHNLGAELVVVADQS